MSARWRSAERSHPGHRRPCNEDAVLSRGEEGLWVVADGMGGHQAGDVASRSICQALAELSLAPTLAERVDQVEDTLLAVNEALRSHGEQRCGGATVGSTVVALLVAEQTGVVLWAGDSRLYRRRNAQLSQITRDHNPISDLLEVGGVTEEQALAADTNVITRAVGGQAGLTLDVAVFDVCPGDTYMLCTDGLYRELTLREMAGALGERRLSKASDRLLDGVLAGAANDNVSFVLTRESA
ncbi:MAG: protein phosphatase 2C domain-containing protein [Pseudomonadota bacterium]